MLRRPLLLAPLPFLVACSVTLIEETSPETGGGPTGAGGGGGATGIEPAKTYPSTPPSFQDAYFEVREITPVFDGNARSSAIVALADGTFAITWILDTEDSDIPTPVYWAFGADKEWSEPTIIPGLPEVANWTDLTLFENGGRLTLVIDSYQQPTVIAEGTPEGLAIVAQVEARQIIQHPGGDLYALTLDSESSAPLGMLRYDGGQFVDAGVSFEAIESGCDPNDASIAYRANGTLVAAARCTTGDGSTWRVASFDGAAWSTPLTGSAISVSLEPVDGTSHTIGVFARPAEESPYSFAPDASFFPHTSIQWDEEWNAAWGPGSIDPWDRPFFAFTGNAYDRSVHSSSDGGATWVGFQVVGEQEQGWNDYAAAFQRTTGYPTFFNGNVLLLWRYTQTPN